MYRSILVSLTILLLVLSVSCDNLPTIRETANGPVEGIEEFSSLGQKYYSFRGIPFAEPPITGRDPYTGEQVDRRFKAPEPLKRRWTEPLKAHDFGYRCIPMGASTKPLPSIYSEDCLFLNIYVPAGGANKKTVLVYIHGGGFANGDTTKSLYGADFLISQDNIVVKIAYRLGIIGFLNLDNDEYTGNMGLKDQQLALKWIYNNIEKFSGNRNEILLFGQSAGGAAVHFQMLNTESQKYFNRVLVSSGVALNSFAVRKANHTQVLQECTKISETKELVDYLKIADNSVLRTCSPFNAKSGSLIITWVPTVERSHISGAFLTKTPREIYSSNEAPVMDTMFTFNTEEMVFFRPNLTEIIEPLLEDDWQKANVELPFEGVTKRTHPEEYKQAIIKLRKAFYLNATNVDEIKRRNIALISYMGFVHGIVKAAVLQTNANNKGNDPSQHKNTFLVRVSINADLNVSNMLLKYKGTTHGDEICYIFHCHSLDNFRIYNRILARKDANYDIIMRTVKMITNFARTGNPSIAGDKPFESSNSPNDIRCNELSNGAILHVTNNIMDEFHYDTLREIEDIFMPRTHTFLDGLGNIFKKIYKFFF